MGSGSFGAAVAVLPNGNFVVTDPTFDVTDPSFVSDAGAVHLYRADGTLISTVTGNCTNDNLGYGGVKVLASGNFAISSPNVALPTPNGTQLRACIGGNKLVLPGVGAATFVNGSTGLTAVVASSNSLMGAYADDRVGEIVPLADGNYLVRTIHWNTDRGAVTWQNGSGFTPAAVSAANSLIGGDSNDLVGSM